MNAWRLSERSPGQKTNRGEETQHEKPKEPSAESFRLRGSRRAGAGRSARGGTAMQEPGRARVLHYSNRGEHSGGEPLQTAHRSIEAKDWQEDRVLYADILFLRGRGAPERMGAARRARSGILCDREKQRPCDRGLRDLQEA